MMILSLSIMEYELYFQSNILNTPTIHFPFVESIFSPSGIINHEIKNSTKYLESSFSGFILYINIYTIYYNISI